MADIQFDSRYKEFDKTRDALGHQTAGLIGFLIKISGGHLKVETANNILVVVTVISFTLSAIIFSNMFFSQKNSERPAPAPISKEAILSTITQEPTGTTNDIFNRLPENFYREDVPMDITNKLPQEVLDLIPTRP